MSLHLKKVRKSLLHEHNQLRKLHGADELKLKSELSEQAQKWAENLALRNCLQHSPSCYKGSAIGENVFGAYNTAKAPDDIATDATASWYSEINAFDFSNPENNLSGCGHFTQIVWKETKHVGFGVARSSDGHVFVVGQYSPPGNFVGHAGENVTPPKPQKEVEHKGLLSRLFSRSSQ